MILWRVAWKDLARHPLRSALTLLGIAIGVGAAVSIFAATDATRRELGQMYTSVTGEAALEVVDKSGKRFDGKLQAEVAQVPHVRAVYARIVRPTISYIDHKRVNVVAGAFDRSAKEPLPNYELTAGEWPEPSKGVVLDAAFAKSLGAGVGSGVTSITRRGVFKTRVTGLVSAKGAAGAMQLATMFFSREDMSRMFLIRGQVDSLQIVLTDEQYLPEVQAAVAQQLPQNLLVRAPSARTQVAEQTLRSVQLGLDFASILSLAMAGFMILNTFLMNVGERRKQLSLLRALGASRRQMIGMVLAEALLLGVAGSLIGAVIGYFGATQLSLVTGRLFVKKLVAPELDPVVFGLALISGPLVAIVAAYLPAYLAGKVSPLEGITGGEMGHERKVPRFLTIVALIVWGISIALFAATITGVLSPQAGLPAGVLMLLAFVLVVSPVLRPLATVAMLPFAGTLGVEGQLAMVQVLRNRIRATLTIAVVIVALSNGYGIGNTLLNSIGDVNTWYERTMVGDFFLRPTAADPEETRGERSQEIIDKIHAVPGIRNLDPVRFAKARMNDESLYIITRELVAAERLPLELVGGQDVPREVLKEGEAVIGVVPANKYKLGVGDIVTLEYGPRRAQVRIAGITNDYYFGGMVLFMDREAAARTLGVDGADLYVMRIDPAQRATVEKQLQEIASSSGLLLQSAVDVTAKLKQSLDAVSMSFWVVLGIGFVVAALAIINTLTMNVLEQSSEIGLLRIIAMTQGQVMKMIFSQAAILGVLGVAIGGVSAILSAWTIHLSLLPLMGRAIPFHWHGWLLLSTLAATFILTVLSAWLPARRAVKLNPLEAVDS